MTEDEFTQTIKDFTPEDLDPATKDKSFRQATAMLLAGKVTVPEWRWFALEVMNEKVDIPLLNEASERDLFKTAFTTVGQLLESMLATDFVDGDLRKKTLALLQGQATVPEWIDVVSEVLDTVIDIPYVPAFGEELVFDRGLDMIAKSLHGLFVGGSKEAKA